jgi:hypothetical protein
VSEFLLLGMRGAGPGEVSPVGAARDLTALTAWLGWLRRWGLLRAFAAMPPGPTAPRACLVVRTSGPAAARSLATALERLGGYNVTVLPLVSAVAAARHSGAETMHSGADAPHGGAGIRHGE